MNRALVGVALVLLVAMGVGAWLFTTSRPETPRGAGPAAPAPGNDTAPDAPLPRVDLCGSTGHTQDDLAERAAEMGRAAFVRWFEETVVAPADLRICDRLDGDQVYRGVPWVRLQALDDKGRPAGVLAEFGVQPPSGTGHRSLSKNVFPKDGMGFGPFGVVLYYRDVVPTP